MVVIVAIPALANLPKANVLINFYAKCRTRL